MGTGGIPAAAAPAQDPGPGGLEAADQAARDRIAGAFPDPLPPGAPAEVAAAATAPPEAPSEFDIFADGAEDSLIADDMPYRDAKVLREQVAKAKQQFKPFNDAFGGLTPEQRDAVLAGAPTIGADLAAFSALAPSLHPDDRAFFFETMQLFATDPRAAAEKLAQGAEILRGQFALPPDAQVPPGTPSPATPDWETGDDVPPADPANAPITRADLEHWQREQNHAAEVKANEDRILAEARELGYDPDSNDPVVAARFNTLLNLAARPETAGDLNRAHKLMEQADQAVIDRFVEAKAANADRPGAPETGAAPLETRVLETLDDGKEAMLSRLAGTLGPDPRHRGED